jgi:hypothetical protein
MSNPSDSRGPAARRVPSLLLALLCAIAAVPALLPSLSATLQVRVATEQACSGASASTARSPTCPARTIGAEPPAGR